MLLFLSENIGTILTALVVFGIVAAVVINMVRKKRRGESAICSGCSGCSAKNHCPSCKE